MNADNLVRCGKERRTMHVAAATVAWVTSLALALAVNAPTRAANYLIDANYAGVDGAPFGTYAGAYKNIVAALNSSAAGSIPAGASAANPSRVYVAPGTYNTANVTGVTLVNQRANIALIGTTGNPNDVVITSTLDAAYVPPGGSAIGTTGSSSLQLRGNNISAAGITFANSTNTPYIVNVGHKAVSPTGDYTTGNAQTANSQGVALKLQGDQQAFLNCKFLGYQDTLYTNGGRSYFKNCYVSGDIDFIFADGTAVFDKSTINMDGDHSGGTITAASTDKRTSNGIVFLNSTVTSNSVKGNPVIDPQNAASATGAPANNMWLGRPWGWTQTGGDASTVFVNTKLPAAIRSAGWLNWNANELNAANGKQDGNPAKDSRYAEFNSMDSMGNPIDVSSRVAWSHQLTASQGAAYTVANLFSFEGNPLYPWYGTAYAGSNDPNNPNYSWPAFWGDRNSNNDTANSIVSAVYPAPGNPAAYSNPKWTIAGGWDPMGQLAVQIPEPSTVVLFGIAVAAITFVTRRRLQPVRLLNPSANGRAPMFALHHKLVWLVAVFGFFAMSSARAATIWDVDFIAAKTMTGAAVVGSVGDVWNTAEVAQAATNLSLFDTSGVNGPNNITLNFDKPGGNLFGFSGLTGNPLNLMDDGFGSSINGGSGTSFAQLSFKFSGLVPNSAYTVYAYGARGAGVGTRFFATVGGAQLGSTTSATQDIASGAGVAYTTFSMTTDALGTFTVLTNFNSSSSAAGPVNGFQIVGASPAPEPASLCLLAAGGMIVFAARKRLATAN